MGFNHLINNMAILFVLALPYRYFVRRWGTDKVWTQVLSGLLFGAAAIVGMMNPIVVGPGLYFDAKTVAAGVGSLVAGPIAAGIIVAMAGAYRIWLGGVGTLTSILVLAASAGLGTAYYYLSRGRPETRKPIFLLAFGLIIHLVMLALMLTLPDPHAWDVLTQLSAPVMLVLPLGAFVLASLLVNVEAECRSEAALREVSGRLGLTVKSSNVGLWDWNLRTNAVYFSPEWKRQLGYAEEEIAGHYEEWERRLHPEDRDRAVATVRAYIAQPWPDYEDEFRLRHRDGSYRWILTRAEVLADRAGKPYRMMGCHIDLTDRKQAEQELRESESEYRNLVEGANSVILRMDCAGRILFMNRFGLKFFGYTQEELLGKYVIGTIVPETDTVGRDLKKMITGIVEQPEDYQNNENENLRKNGERVRVAWTNRAILDCEGRCVEICCVGNDVTAHRRAEAELAQQATAMEQAAEAIVVTGTDGKITYVNHAFEAITGYTRAEVLGCNPHILKSGKQDAAFYEALWATLTSGANWHGQFTNKRKNGTLYEAEATIAPVRDVTGRIVNYVAVERDVTEKRLLERRLRQSQKLGAIGTLAGGIAHDFNNVLAAIIGYSEFASDALPEGSPLREDLSHVLTAAARARDLVRQILVFSRDSEPGRQALQPVLIVKEALKFLRPSLPATIEIHLALENNAGMVLADPTELHQVIMNLCTNAYHAMREHAGCLTVAVNKVSVDAHDSQANPELKPGRYVRLTVADTGCGMDAETMEHIFDPFFTTKPEGEGTGLGLATVYAIVASCGGTVTVYSEPQQGTTFHVYLPSADAETETAPDAAESTVYIGGTERIMVVDDEGDLVRCAAFTLDRLGYHVIGFTDSEKALAALALEPQRFDLLLTDLTMPKLTGLQLAREALRIRPDLPVILHTGSANPEVVEQAKAAGVRDLIEKPVNIAKMASVIRNALDKRHSAIHPEHASDN